MSIIPTFYRTKKIYSVVDEIIESYDVNSYFDVSFSDKLSVCASIISYQSENNCTDWLDALSEKEFAKLTAEYLTRTSSVNRIEMLANFKESIVSHYEELMRLIFNERIEIYEENRRSRNEDY